MRLDGKVALVTGSSRGIGRAIATAFDNEGANVAVTYKQNEEMAKDLVKGFKNSLAIHLDVTKRESIRDTVSTIMKKYQKIDILVNNAGINIPADFEDITDEDWDLVIDTNLKSAFMVSQEVFSIMKAQNYGRIINIASVSGQYGGPRTAHYAISKAGIISLGHCLARFGASYNITANNISPGIILTEMADNILQSKLGREIIDRTLLKKAGTPNEVADAAVFLASEESAYVTGQTFNVNGGLLMS